MPQNTNFSEVPQPFDGMNGYEVLCPKGTLLGVIERRFVRDMSLERTAVTVETRSRDALLQLRISSCGGREVIRARPDQVRRLASFTPREQIDLWGMFRIRLAAIPRPVTTLSEGARDLASLIDDVRALVAENDRLLPGRVALVELAWQRLHTLHDPDMASIRLGDALRPGPDVARART